MEELIFEPWALLGSVGWLNLFLIILGGLFIGAVLGAVPGITATVAVALMLPPSIYMPPILGIIFLSSIYTGGVYGGGVMSIALNIPGSGAAVATTFDGYPMTRKGKYYMAVGYGLVSSAIGCFVAYLAIFFLLLPIGRFAVKFGPPEMLMVALFAFTIIGVVTGGLLKSLLGGFLGLLLGTIGSNIRGVPRGTFGAYELMDGLPLVVVIIGLFAISEALFLLDRESIIDEEGKEFFKKKYDLKGILSGMRGAFKYYVTLVRSSLIGLGVGIIPAAGATIASIISYGQAKSKSKEGHLFGEGCPEGVVAAETANNASEAGAMTTMLCFGIPGSGSTAILMGAFIIHGIVPGPYLVRDHLDFAYAIILSNFFQAFLLIFIGMLLILFVGKVISLPSNILIPLIIVTSVIGSYSARPIWLDVPFVFAFGIFGYILRKYDYQLISLLIGLILSAIAEGEFFRTYSLYSGKLLTLFERPIFTTLFVFTLISVFSPPLKRYWRNRKNRSR